jgi:hypothetical protein
MPGVGRRCRSGGLAAGRYPLRSLERGARCTRALSAFGLAGGSVDTHCRRSVPVLRAESRISVFSSPNLPRTTPNFGRPNRGFPLMIRGV